MKKKILLFAIISALLAVLVIGIGISAAEEPTIAIKYGNISYTNDGVTLYYAVDYEGISANAEHGLLIWRGEPAKHYLKGREDVIILSDKTVKIDGKTYYQFALDGISEHEITDDVYAVAYARVGTRIYYSSVNKHSPLRYSYIAEGKIGNTPIEDEKILSFLSEMITNGAEAQKRESYKTDRLADSEFVEINITSGSFADGLKKALLPVGSKVAVIADESYGEQLSDWVDASGASIAADGIEYVIVPSVGTTITPKYVKASTGIEYFLGAEDAKFDTEPPTSYEFGKAFEVPTPRREGYLFAGWYADPSYDASSAMSVIPEGHKGNVKLYASWSKRVYVDNYTTLSGVLVEAGTSKTNYATSGNTQFRAANSDGSYFHADGKGVIWHTGTTASDIYITRGLAGLMGDDNIVTIRVSLASVDGKPVAASNARLRVSYKNETISIFNVATDGCVYLGGDQAYKIATLTSELQSVNIIVDFERGEIAAASADGSLLGKKPINVPSGSKHGNLIDWKNDTTGCLINWFAGSSNTDNALRVGEVSVYSGAYGLKSSERVVSTDELAAKLEALIAENSAFTADRFLSKYSPYAPSSDLTMPAPVYNAAPALYPRDDGTGTRLMLTNSMIAGILATLEDESYDKAYGALISLADSQIDGRLGAPSLNYNGRKGLHNFSNSVLATIEAKALMFRLLYEQDLEEGSYDAYRRDVYGYEAIVCLKNFLETMHIEYINSDQCREYGYAMFVAAEVYDWCYPILTAKDKQEIKYAVVARCCSGTSGSTDNSLTTNGGAKMEVGYPPSGQGSVSGHGSEAQILRDYLAFALAIYDEDPTWWEYVAGRVVGDYVQVRNYYFQSGITQQGVSNYAHHRHYSDLYSAWIIQTATGKNPYVGMENTVRSVIGSINPSGNAFFSSGDGAIERATSAAANLALVASAIFNDDTLFTWASDFKSGFNITSASGTSTVTIANMFIFISQGMETVEDKYSDLELVTYNGYPLEQMVTRYKWNDPNAAGTYMKIGVRTTANHEHRDAGTFQIYYKGLLTSDSGLYNNYGHEHTQQYQQATIGHNGLLVFNPAKWNYSSSTYETKWYSGGQRKPGESKNLQAWLDSSFDMAELIGAQYGYKNAEGTLTDYAYIAGDITKAYTADTVAYMSRNMLTVYNDGDSATPMYFFVFDSIESTDASFKKTFLLHVRGLNEPTVNGNVITTANGDGKLVVHSLTDGVTISKVGGIVYDANGKYDAAASSNYLVNGYQLVPLDKGNDGNWGRVEVSIDGSKKSTFMHAMYVTDKDSTVSPSVKKVVADGIEGAIIDNVAAIFRDSTKATLQKVEFKVEGTSEMRYYVAGLFEGSWKLTVDGKSCGTVMAGCGGMAVFTAPAGEVVLTPGDDIMPEGGGHIFYETNGGTLPESAPTAFKQGGGVLLPTPTLGISEFAGWYTTPDLTGEPIDRIPADAVGEFTVYAKWNRVFVSEDFENVEVDISGIGDGKSLGALNLQIVDGSKAEMRLKTDKNTKLKYLVVSPAGGDIRLTSNGYANIESMGIGKITYSIELATSSEDKSPRAVFTLKGTKDYALFTISAAGALSIGNTKIATLTKTLEKYSFTLDFDAKTLTVCNGSGDEIYSGALGVTIDALKNSLFEMSITDGKSGLTKHNLCIGSIDVRASK